MVGIANDDQKRMLRPMMTAGAFRLIADELACVVEIDIRPTPLTSPAPATKADHFVVFGPLGERVIGRVNARKTAAAFDELDERCLCLLRPRLAVVVRDDQLVLFEL